MGVGRGVGEVVSLAEVDVDAVLVSVISIIEII